MKYNKTVVLKDDREIVLRNGTSDDGENVFNVFNKTHDETDYLLSYPDENCFDAKKEGEFLKKKTESRNEIEILAILEGKVIGIAGIDAIGTKDKVKHRAEVGIAILKEYWGLGIGSVLLNACIECARQAGYVQLELNVVSDNERAISMYKKAGFIEFGRNPKGFHSRFTGYQEVIYMRLELS